MLQPLAHEHKAPVDPVAGDFAVRLRDDRANLCLRLGRQYFIGIKNEHPLVSERDVLQYTVFLFGPGAIENKLNHLRTE